MKASLFWTLFRKDVRSLLPWLAFFWLAIATVRLVPPPSYDADLETYMGYGAWVMDWPVVAWGFFVLTVARLVQMDDFRDDRGFLSTKPVDRTMIFRSKIAVIGACFVLPLLLLDGAYKAHFGFGWGPRELALNCFRDFLEISGLTCVAVLPALLTRQLGYFVLIMLALGFCAFFVPVLGNMVLLGSGDDSHGVSQAAAYLKTSCNYAAGCVAIVGALVAANIFVRTLSRRRFWTALAVAAVMTFATWIFWPVNFAQWLDRANYSAVAPAADWPDPAKVSIGWIAPRETDAAAASVRVPYTFRTVYIGDGPSNEIDGHYEVSGLPPGWYVDDDIRTSSMLHLSNKQNSSYAADLMPFTSTDPLGAILGAPLSKSVVGSDSISAVPDHTQIGAYEVSAIRGAQTGAELSGQVTFEFRRPVVRAQLPLVEGATADIDQCHYTIVKVTASGKSVQVILVREGVLLDLAGGASGAAEFVLWNSTTHEIAVAPKDKDDFPVHNFFVDRHNPGSVRFDDDNFFAITLTGFVEKTVCDWMRPPADGSPDEKNAPDIDETWMRDARLVLVTSEYGGEKTVPFDFKDMTLPLAIPDAQP